MVEESWGEARREAEEEARRLVEEGEEGRSEEERRLTEEGVEKRVDSCKEKLDVEAWGVVTAL